MNTWLRRVVAITLLTFLGPLLSDANAQVGRFKVHLDDQVFDGPFTGEVFVAFADLEETREPRSAMHAWFGAPPLLRFEISAGKGDLLLTPADAAACSPTDWTEIQAGEWRIQVIARRSPTGRKAGLSPGDVFSDVIDISYDPAAKSAVELLLDHVVVDGKFPETDRLQLFEFVSPALSAFHGFEYTMQAGVRLPRNYKEGEHYPVLYSITGFGGTAKSIASWKRRAPEGSTLDECIIVVPDASNLYGHSVFCDSDSIGPWGHALVYELIPALEEKFGGAGAEQRYLTGGSSGGWSALWLQVAYPEEFAGCWSHVPDPIDFFDFQQINLYEPLADGTPRNMYVDEQGEPRPLARRDGKVTLTYEGFVRREDVLNPGGQIRSFEGTFSPLGADGTPSRVFDVETGVIDHEVAKHWRKYDISHILLTQWEDLRGSLAGKIHVYAGEQDTFYLEGAVERFMQLAEEAGMLDEMVIEVIPGMTHSWHPPGGAEMERRIAERRMQSQSK
jgi:S-formylglutathione hydrolase FrmB